MQERDSQSPAGPQKQLQFEVSVNTERDIYYSPPPLPHHHLPLPNETGPVAGHAQKYTLTCTLYETESYLVPFQELECAVSMEEDNRQEWTFTLYDFDNSGKVTREVKMLLICICK